MKKKPFICQDRVGTDYLSQVRMIDLAMCLNTVENRQADTNKKLVQQSFPYFYIFAAGLIQATANIDSITTLAYDMTITVSDDKNSGTPRKLTIVITGKGMSPVKLE